MKKILFNIYKDMWFENNFINNVEKFIELVLRKNDIIKKKAVKH